MKNQLQLASGLRLTSFQLHKLSKIISIRILWLLTTSCFFFGSMIWLFYAQPDQKYSLQFQNILIYLFPIISIIITGFLVIDVAGIVFYHKVLNRYFY